MNYKHGLTNRIKICPLCSKEFKAKNDYKLYSQVYCNKQCYWKILKGKEKPSGFKEKRRDLTRKEWQNPEIRKKRLNGMTGREVTEETKNKISLSNKKRWENKSIEERQCFSQKARERQNKLWQNKEYKELMCKNHTGKIGYWRNKKRPLSTRIKISIAHWGKKTLQITKDKLSAKTRESWKDETIRGRRIIKMSGRICQLETRKKIGKSNANNYSSPEIRRKMSEMRKGDKSHFWKGGIANRNDIIRHSVEISLWRDKVFKRDNYTCQKCKQYGGGLEAHHIKAFSKYPELRFDINNGITLCKNCHRKTENYGSKECAKHIKENILNKIQ